MMFCKWIIVVDEQVNVHDEQQVFFHLGANWDPRRDTVIIDGPVDILDHAAPYYGNGQQDGLWTPPGRSRVKEGSANGQTP